MSLGVLFEVSEILEDHCVCTYLRNVGGEKRYGWIFEIFAR